MVTRIGLLGGTFDPPHVGHLVVADQVRTRLDLDEVRLVVSNRSWQKVGTRRITSAERRLALVEAAVGDAPGLRASSIELELGGPSYTKVTVDELDRREPGVEWLVIVGADAAAGLDTWHRADELRAERTVVVVNRPGAVGPVPEGWNVVRVDIPALDVSSTEIRSLVAAGRSIRYLTPDPVVRQLTSWGLYREAP